MSFSGLKGIKSLAPIILGVIFCAFAAFFSSSNVPVAFGAFSNPDVDTVAQVRTDGSLYVAEQRAFAFDEAYSILTWEFTGITGEQEVDVDGVRVARLGDDGVVQEWQTLEAVSFQPAWRDFVWDTEGIAAEVDAKLVSLRANGDAANDVTLPREGSYALDARSNKLYIFIAPTDASIVVECDYLIENAALVYNDVAELYWDYVAAKQDIVTRSVNVQIQLPVPEGATVVPGDNVMAWGHGPYGTIEIKSDGTVHFAVDEVRSAQYAQAHVIFPSEWLTNLTIQQKLAKSGVREDNARAEEDAWADSYSAGLINRYSLGIATAIMCILALILAVVVYARRGREPAPSIDQDQLEKAADYAANTEGGSSAEDERHVISDYDAAVIGRLLRWNHRSSSDFSATVDQLAKRGVIAVAQGDNTRFRITPRAKDSALSPVERAAMEFLFEDVGAGYQAVSLNEVREYCKHNAQAAQEKLKAWQELLTREVSSAGVFDAASNRAAKRLAVFAAVIAAVGVAVLAASWLRGVMLLVTAIVIAAIAYHIPRRTQLGADLAAQVAGNIHEDAPWEDELSSILKKVLTTDVS